VVRGERRRSGGRWFFNTPTLFFASQRKAKALSTACGRLRGAENMMLELQARAKGARKRKQCEAAFLMSGARKRGGEIRRGKRGERAEEGKGNNNHVWPCLQWGPQPDAFMSKR